jgi:hypothetical protein
MSEPSDELQPAIADALRADAGVATAMGGKARIYDVAPANAPVPYIIVGCGQILDQIYDCIDAAEVLATLDIWSKTDPPGSAQARAIAKAAKAVVVAMTADLPSHRIIETLPLDTVVLTDFSDNETIHAVVRIQIDTDPL